MSQNQEKKFHTKYPAFIVGIDTKAVVEMGLTPNCLDNKPWWWFEDNGAALGLSDETPNSKLVNSRIVLRQRNRLESDESVLQILPYTIIGWLGADNDATKVSTYYRVPGAGEQRLDGKSSIGWGGHIEYEDFSWMANGDLDLYNTILTNLGRELEEECIFIDTRTGSEVHVWSILDHKEALKFRGFIHDTANSVGRTHLAVVHFLELPAYISVKKKENVHLDGPVRSLNELNEHKAEYEPWSRIIIEDHFLRAEAVYENMSAHQSQIENAQYHRLAVAAGQSEVVETPANVLHETVLGATLREHLAKPE
jgi:predicted NUDIX family phosphoesterase